MHLPLTRSNEDLRSDEAYLNSAVQQVDSLIKYCPLSSESRVLDFGCGQGRFAIGLGLRVSSLGSYCGIDTNPESVTWCKRWLEPAHENFSFVHLPAHNARYNPTENSRQALPTDDNSVDVVFMNSVFSHMLTDDITYYLGQFHRILNSNGVLYTTAFIEDGVPDVEENPEGYLGKKSTGALHRVRYEKAFFFKLLKEAGFEIVDFVHHKFKRTKQSLIVARKCNA